MSEWFPTFYAVWQTPWRELWHQFRYTPIRDLIRLRLSGRLDWKSNLAATDLATDIRQQVTDVVKATRLWPLEKAEITTELIAHFQDGQLAGKSHESLLADFGDTQTVAKLMRSGKMRNRTLLWRTCVSTLKTFSVLAVLLSLAYGLLAIWLYSAAPNPTVDFLAELNAPAQSSPLADQAWPIYREAWIEHDIKSLNTYDQLTDPVYTYVIGPDDDRWPSSIEFLDQHASLVDAARIGGRLPGLGLQLYPDWRDYPEEDYLALWGQTSVEWQREHPEDSTEAKNPLLLGVLLPHAQEFRSLGYILEADMLRSAEAGNVSRVIEDWHAMLGLSPQLIEMPSTVCSQIASAVRSQALRAIGRVLIEYPDLFDQAQLTCLRQRIESDSARDFFTSEPLFYLDDLLQNVYSDDGNGDGRITAQGLTILNRIVRMYGQNNEQADDRFSKLLVPAEMLRAVSRKDVRQIIEKWNDENSVDYTKSIREQPLRVTKVDEYLSHYETRDPCTWRVLKMMLIGSDDARKTVEVAEAQRAAVLVGIAVTEYRLRHHRWPRDLDELLPTFLSDVPPDPVTGDSLKYRLIDGRPVLYSVGGDRDDDGGLHPVNKYEVFSSDPNVVPEDGDWLLWPANSPQG